VQEINNTVADCTVSHAAVEFRGHPALLVGFSRGTTLEHNELSQLPYSAISLGWGWDVYPYTYGGLNQINYNHIHDHMRVLGDGGAIYTLGAQGNLPFEMPTKFKNVTEILPPSVRAITLCFSSPNCTDIYLFLSLTTAALLHADTDWQLDPRRWGARNRTARSRRDRRGLPLPWGLVQR